MSPRFETPKEADLGLVRIANTAGMAISVLPNGCLFAIEHQTGAGRILINQVHGSPLGGGIGPWRYAEGAYANVVPSLERAFAKNPAMKLYVGQGYYDMATPFWAVQYTLDHMILDPKVRAQNITVRHFDSGHMMYIEKKSLEKLKSALLRVNPEFAAAA